MVSSGKSYESVAYAWLFQFMGTDTTNMCCKREGEQRILHDQSR